MSTSEFDRQWEEPDHDLSSRYHEEWESWEVPEAPTLPEQSTGLPEDFTEEDIAFAHEMEAMFSPASEEMPPYYVQTLLEAESPRFQPAEEGIEYRTKARVFRRLHLRRRLFNASHSSSVGRRRFAVPHVPRSLFVLMTACFLFMLFTMVATGPSFASGLALLLSGPHSGVMQVNGYPPYSIKSPHSLAVDADINVQGKSEDLLTAQQQLQFTMYQPLYVPTNYVLNTVSLYQSDTRDWANGPIMEMDYSYTYPGSRHEPSQISICEFKPNGQVYQVVQVGAAHYVQLGQDASVRAIYVDGEWIRINKFSHDWVYGSRNEIIYEQDGVIFWIASSGQAGVSQSTLLSIASSLQPLDARAAHLGAHISVNITDDSTNWPFANDVVYENGPAGSSLEVVGADLSSANAHTVTSMQIPQ